VERRKSTRFRLRCEVTCTWRDEYGVTKTVTATTADISAGGLFISTQESPVMGIIATLGIQLPKCTPAGPDLQLRGTGRVVRIVRDGTRTGFAVAGALGWMITRERKAETVIPG
jgi:hypothetical protein